MRRRTRCPGGRTTTTKLDYVIACLAILRAGGAFLVLELAYPSELLSDVLKDASRWLSSLTRQKLQGSKVRTRSSS
ncbi:hypothetical protein MRB53_040327 [Persea americana]|nr:hypothetical protein MRB53_040327 [Persea americana]